MPSTTSSATTKNQVSSTQTVKTSTQSITNPVTTNTKTSTQGITSSTVCANVASDTTCNAFSRFCNTDTIYFGNLIFYNACKKTCNKCETNLVSTTNRPISVCQNIGSELTCVFFSRYCGSKTVYLGNLVFSEACKKTCNIC